MPHPNQCFLESEEGPTSVETKRCFVDGDGGPDGTCVLDHCLYADTEEYKTREECLFWRMPKRGE